MSGPDSPTPPHIYHERQVRALCAMHTLNNLFQQDAFNQRSMDELCFHLDKAAWINPHKSVWGVGDYDVNAIQAALMSKGYTMVWFNKKLNANELDVENIFGFIMNVPAKKPNSVFGTIVPSFTSNRHWYSIRNLPSQGERQQALSHFYNLDSNLDQPRSIGNRLHLVHLIREQMSCEDKHLFLVVTPEVAKNASWRLPFPPPPTDPVFTDNRTDNTDASMMEGPDDHEPWL